MKRLFKNILSLIVVSNLCFATYADTCSQLEAELKDMHKKQDTMKKSDSADEATLLQLKKERDAQMAQIIALKSLKKIRNQYLDFRREAENLNVADLFDKDTSNALLELERHTQAVATYGVVHSTVAALAKKQADSIAKNAQEDNVFVKLFNHLKNGDGKNLYSYMKSACDDASEDVQQECSVFNDFTTNFELDSHYKQNFTDAINNYGTILKKIYAGVATPEDAQSFLNDHVETLSTDTMDILLSITADNKPSIDINKSANTLNLLSDNQRLKDYYKDTVFKLKEEVIKHNEDKSIIDTGMAQKLLQYFDPGISETSFKTLSDSLNNLKNCERKLSTCPAGTDLAKLADTINESLAETGSDTRIDRDKVSVAISSNKENTKDKIDEFRELASEELETLNTTTNNNFNLDQLLSEKLKELCPRNSSSGDLDQQIYKCVESELSDNKLNSKIADHESKLASIEGQIAEIFDTQPMRDLELMKALALKDYRRSCSSRVEEVEISCMPKISTGDEGIKALILKGRQIEDKLLTEDYARYYYGSTETDHYNTSKKYLEKFCPQSNKIVCSTGLDGGDGDIITPDQFERTCSNLRHRMCNQMKVSVTKSTFALSDDQYYDWDPIKEKMVKKKEKDIWPHVAMYAANNTYAFMGPMIATQQLRARLPGMVYAGRVQQQAYAYQKQYYDWYMDRLDLSNPYLFNFNGSSVFYGNTGTNWGYSF